MSGGIRLLRARDYVRTPWKNGGGETTEIACWPPGASLDTFDWRISMARVAADGPFSVFPEIDRTLAILDGRGIGLTVGERARVELRPADPPFAFPADVATTAWLLDGAVADLNVMTRRGRFVHAVTSLRVNPDAEIAIAAPVVAVLCAGGPVGIETPRGPFSLSPHDAVLGEDRVGDRWRLRADKACRVFVVALTPQDLCPSSARPHDARMTSHTRKHSVRPVVSKAPSTGPTLFAHARRAATFSPRGEGHCLRDFGSVCR